MNCRKYGNNWVFTTLGFPTQTIRTRIIRVFFTIRTKNTFDQILELFEYLINRQFDETLGQKWANFEYFLCEID